MVGVRLILPFQSCRLVTDTYVNSVDPDEMAHNEPSNQDPQ